MIRTEYKDIKEIIDDTSVDEAEKIRRIQVKIDKFNAPKSNKQTNFVTQTMIDHMKEMRSEGLSFEEISREMNLSLTAVRYHLIDKEKQLLKRANSYEKQKANYAMHPEKYEHFKAYQREYQKKKRQLQSNQVEELNANKSNS